MKYRKKPVIIEAEQFFKDKEPWPVGVELGRPTIMELESLLQRGVTIALASNGWSYMIRTLEGTHFLSDGDFVITGIKGERYPCKPDIFAATYEAV